jgi:two-component system sensor kinase FixL
MSETISSVSTCPSDPECSTLERESQRLQDENERLAGELEEQTRQRHRAEQKQADINAELAHFAYVVSHDLRAPLRGIRLITEWLCEDYGEKLGPEAKEQIALLQNRVNRVQSLVDGVLQYSRIGRINEDPVAVNLNELLPMIVESVAPPAHLRITIAPHLPTLTCEKTRIVQVFQHLLTNAVTFMDKPQGEIHVGCVEEPEHWRFRVADNGPGIGAKHFERIFRLFQTLASKEEQGSTGVGLTLVKKIVELYGGKVWVESEIGKGSTFFFTFPKKSETDVPPYGAAPGAGRPADETLREP